MDCEKFDLHLIDELYDELDEVTHAAMKRHGEGCARCAGVLSRLRATREVGVLPLVEPSDGFESRVLTAAYAAQRKAPWHRKVMRAVAWAGSHAMRPQLAMAAVLVMCLGASLMLLRAPRGAPVRVTERGEPAPDVEQAPVAVAEPPAAAAPEAAGAMPADSEADRGRAAVAGKGAKEKAIDGAEASKDKDAAVAALTEARAVRSKSGCSAAVSKFDDVGVRFAGTAAAADAMWEAASCYKQMGNTDRARELYVALRNYGAYKDRAEAELQLAAASNQNNYGAPGGGAGPRQGVAAAPMPRAAPAKKPAAVAADPFDAQEAPAPPSPPSQAPGGSKSTPAAPRKDLGL